MSRQPSRSGSEADASAASGEVEATSSTLVDLLSAADEVASQPPTTSPEALTRMTVAEDTLRAIRAGEVDAFVVSDGARDRRVFTLSTADRPYRVFVENMRDGAATLSANGTILYANGRLAELTSRPIASIVGAPLSAFVAGGLATDFGQHAGQDGAAIELELVDRDGRTVPVLVGSSPLELDGEQLTCLTFTDMSVQREHERRIAGLIQAQDERLADLQEASTALTQLATHDPLTGLPNRGLLVDRIDQALLHARRSGRNIAVLFIDLDGFKQINDTRGHAAGDKMLAAVADMLTGLVRPMDTVARIGGDEFVVFAPDIASQLHAVDMGTRLLAKLSGPELIGASIGISVSAAGRGTAEILLTEADRAMYRAKSRGGGRAEVFDAALAREVKERSIAERMLQSALDDRRVIAHYQPIVDLSTGQVAGLEALARIAEHDGSIVLPGTFIAVAEDTALIVQVGTQVLALACQETRGWQPAEPSETRISVAVNISARQFGSGDLATVVREQLERAELHPSCLHLELTETVVLHLGADITQQLQSITDIGVQVGLDDFGTGYASLTHLRRLPLSFVKIDQSFVQGIGKDREDERIVAAVVDLAANLGLRSIAEGVETTVQLDFLRALGCNQAQGYIVARPLNPLDVPSAIRRLRW